MKFSAVFLIKRKNKDDNCFLCIFVITVFLVLLQILPELQYPQILRILGLMFIGQLCIVAMYDIHPSRISRDQRGYNTEPKFLSYLRPCSVFAQDLVFLLLSRIHLFLQVVRCVYSEIQKILEQEDDFYTQGMSLKSTMNMTHIKCAAETSLCNFIVNLIRTQ